MDILARLFDIDNDFIQLDIDNDFIQFDTGSNNDFIREGRLLWAFVKSYKENKSGFYWGFIFPCCVPWSIVR